MSNGLSMLAFVRDFDATSNEFDQTDSPILEPFEQEGENLFEATPDSVPEAGKAPVDLESPGNGSEGQLVEVNQATQNADLTDSGLSHLSEDNLNLNVVQQMGADELKTVQPQSQMVQDAPLALYRRYRPDSFDEVIGQEHVTEPLKRALKNNKVAHAYLFSGPRGCGKTTSARILARCLNCEQGPTDVPCGKCRSCVELATSGPGSIDVIEIDAASHGKVEDARDLRERAFFAPVQSRFKVYIIDEAHMVTTQGFNALLKVVEEPPPHVKFIFATTEPEKVLGTIRSRTHHYPFRLVPPKIMGAFLQKICDQEQVKIDHEVLPLAVRAGGGSVRDALSIIDQLISGAGETGVTYRQAAALLGFTSDLLLDQVTDAFANRDAKAVFQAIDRVIEAGQDPRRFAEDLLDRLRDLMVLSAVPDAVSSGLIDMPADRGEILVSQAKKMGRAELTRAGQIIVDGLSAMRGTTAPRLNLELMCSRVLLPGASTDENSVNARLDKIERKLAVLSSGPTVKTDQADGKTRTGLEPNQAASHDSDQLVDQNKTVLTSSAHPAISSRPTTKQVTEPSAGSKNIHPDPRNLARGKQPSGQRPPDNRPRRPGSKQNNADSVSARDAVTQQDSTKSAPAGKTDQSQVRNSSHSLSPAGGSSGGQITWQHLSQVWDEVVEKMKEQSKVSAIILSQNVKLSGLENQSITLAFDSAGPLHSFKGSGHDEKLVECLHQILGTSFSLNLVVQDSPAGHGPNPGGSEKPVKQPPAAPDPGLTSQQTTSQPTSAVAYSNDPLANKTSNQTADPQAENQNLAEPKTASFVAQAKNQVRETVIDGGEVEPENELIEEDIDLENDQEFDSSTQTASELLISELGAEIIDNND